VGLAQRYAQRPSRSHVAAKAPSSSNSPISPAKIGSTPTPRTTLASRIFTPIQPSPRNTLDARTGNELWRWYVVPKPGEPGSEQASKETSSESFEYKMQPIVLIVPRGSAPSAMETRRKEAEALRNRVQSCEDANALFKSMQNAAIREPITKTSADMPASLREVLDKTPIGHLTEPEVTKQGIEMVALCGRKPTTVDTPKKKEIRDKMYVDKYDAKSKAYLQEVRKAAMIEYR